MNDDQVQDLIMSFAKSLTLADNMGDVWDEVAALFAAVNIDLPFASAEELKEKLDELEVKYMYER
jgi:hypothetical protein